MVRRPWPIVILAILHWLSPLPNLAFSSHLYDVSFQEAFLTSLNQDNWFRLFKAYLLLPLAGVAIYSFKKWSYAAFMVLMALSFYGNYGHWQRAPDAFTLPILVGSYAMNILLVSYFLLVPSVRAPYHNPLLRWWERKPRYRIKIKGQALKGRHKIECTVRDFSEGGALIQSQRALRIKDSLQLSFRISGLKILLKGKVIHKGRPKKGFYGIQFIEVSTSQKKTLHLMAQTLKRKGTRVGNQPKGDWNDFVQWSHRLATTGQGLIPEVHSTKKPKTKKATASSSKRKKRVSKKTA